MALEHIHSTQYFERMAAALGDKVKILEHLVPGNVLDIGAGGGELSQAMAAYGRTVYALDAAESAVERITALGEANVHPVLGYVADLPNLFAPASFDNIVCCSILHEVYSYGVAAKTPGTLSDLSEALNIFMQLLKPGGRLIIRDGVRPTDWTKPVQVRFSEADGREFLNYFRENSPFWGNGVWQVSLEENEQELWEGNLSSAMEFLYTYTWGWKDAAREVQEFYGVLTEQAWVAFLAQDGFDVVHHEQYLQDGYPKFLLPKAQLLSMGGTELELPSSNMLVVAEK